MIQLKPIKTSDTQYYQFMEGLLTEAFPPEEYRPLEDLRKYTDQKKNFRNNIILYNDIPVGFITYWQFEHFFYIEHLAIKPEYRNKGYGKYVIEQLHNQLNLPIVLEVERDTEEIAKRRIHFYQRHGFCLWKNDYSQPPYRKGDHYLPMYLMVYGGLTSENHFEMVKRKLYNAVYNIIT